MRENVVRVWRLGSLEHRTYPTPEMFRRLGEILLGLGDGDQDIMWGPDIDVLELRGTGDVNIVTGPGIRVKREGNVVTIESAPTQ